MRSFTSIHFSIGIQFIGNISEATLQYYHTTHCTAHIILIPVIYLDTYVDNIPSTYQEELRSKSPTTSSYFSVRQIMILISHKN